LKRGSGSSRLLSALLSASLTGMIALPVMNNLRQELPGNGSSLSASKTIQPQGSPLASLWWEPAPLSASPDRQTRQPALSTMGSTEIRGVLREGENVANLLKRLQVSTTIQDQIVGGFKGSFDFKRVRPQDMVSILLDNDGKLLSCTFRTDSFASFTLAKTMDGWHVSQDTMPLVSHTVRINGTIRQPSLAEAFGEAGADAKLAGAFVDIISPLIDLDQELAEDDRFSLLVEKYYQSEQFLGYGKILMARYVRAAGDERLEAVYFEAGERSGYFSPDGRSLAQTFLPLPVPSAWIASRFSRERRHPILGIVRPHLGIDLAAPKGTPVMAAADGLVDSIDYNGGFGKQIVLKHAGGFRTHYGHLSRYQPGLAKGDRVKKQDVIGYVGATGLATGPHLDYRVERHGDFIDPLGEEFLNPPALREAELFRLRLSAEIYDLFMEGRDQHQVLAVRELNPAGHSLAELAGSL
jgi:murein DD-endopeptidase MepM/ murein hydrolase activator NlpD